MTKTEEIAQLINLADELDAKGYFMHATRLTKIAQEMIFNPDELGDTYEAHEDAVFNERLTDKALTYAERIKALCEEIGSIIGFKVQEVALNTAMTPIELHQLKSATNEMHLLTEDMIHHHSL